MSMTVSVEYAEPRLGRRTRAALSTLSRAAREEGYSMEANLRLAGRDGSEKTVVMFRGEWRELVVLDG